MVDRMPTDFPKMKSVGIYVWLLENSISLVVHPDFGKMFTFALANGVNELRL